MRWKDSNTNYIERSREQHMLWENSRDGTNAELERLKIERTNTHTIIYYLRDRKSIETRKNQ